MAELASFTVVLAVEVDGSARPGGQTSTALGRQAAMLLAEAMGADLSRLEPAVADCALVLAGALYDQIEVLRPGFPLLEALETIHRAGLRETPGFVPGIIALGVEAGRRFPVAALNPGGDHWRGPLLLTPAVLVGPVATVDSVVASLEPRLLHEGRAGPPLREALAQHFGIRPVHVSYATLADLCALLNVQLENAGLLPLWELLQHAFVEHPGSARIELPEGNRFQLQDKVVTSPFLSLARWALDHPEPVPERTAGYLRWTQLQRQYATALDAYGLAVQQGVEHDQAAGATAGWLRETARDRSDTVHGPAALVVTEHSHPALGIVAYSADLRDEAGGLLRRDHYYPLRADALEPLLGHLEALAAAARVPMRTLRPGGVTVSAGDDDLTAADAQAAHLLFANSLGA